MAANTEDLLTALGGTDAFRRVVTATGVLPTRSVAGSGRELFAVFLTEDEGNRTVVLEELPTEKDFVECEIARSGEPVVLMYDPAAVRSFA